ncbi:MAG: GNAT family N-acetyltransferase [Chloroflexota bacterium]
MNVQSYTNASIFEELSDEWNALLQRSITNTPFSSVQWHSIWWEVFNPGDLWVVTIRDDGNTLRGIASMFIIDNDGTKTLHLVGCEDVTDYVDFLVDAEYADDVFASIAQALVDNKDKYDNIDFCNIPAESQSYTAFPEVLTENGFTTETARQEVCPVVTLDGDFDTYLGSLDKKQRKELQRKLRRAKGAGDSINFYIVGDEHDLDAEIEKFLDLMASSHPEKAEFLADEANRTFMQKIIPAMRDAGWLQLNFLEVVGDPAASYLNFIYNDEVLVYNSGLDPQKAAALSPGIILLCYNIQHAIENEHGIFNFLRGDESYKYKMGGVDTEIFNLKASL